MSPPTLHPSFRLPDGWAWPSPQDPERWVQEIYDVLVAAPGFRLSLEQIYEHVATALESMPKNEEHLKVMRDCVRFTVIQNNVSQIAQRRLDEGRRLK